MPLLSTRLVPEFQHYVAEYVHGSILNRTLILAPSDIPHIYLDEDKSFIKLLFSDNWAPYDHNYRYLYRLSDRTAIPQEVLLRLMIYPSSSQYYLCDSDSTSICNVNLYNLQSDDLMMLDKLLEYRLDSTSTDIIGIDYSTLSTNLSKLIYIFLDLKINHNFSLYNTPYLISDPGQLLENSYEAFIIEQIFRYVSNRNI